jgi:putative flavoprotein involved in K+ transport
MEAIIIGAGQAGLAAGYYLARQGRRFAILDAAPRLGHAWRTRYDSLRLFTSGPYDSLPGLPFPAPADHYPGKDEVADYLERYAATFELPVRLDTPVRALAGGRDGAPFRVVTDRGVLDAGQVIVATGPFQRPVVPPFAADLSPAVFRAHSSAYRNPAQIPDGEVLVVGAGNSGAQIAEELARARGVTLAGRVVGASVDTVSFADGASMKPAAIIWATGFRPDYDWIDLPVFDEAGRPVHRRGVTAISGLYFLGLPWLYRRGSALLGGVGEDAGYIAGRVAALAASRRATGRDDASVALAASR